MLPDPLRLLMVAYASGELSPRRRRAAERLLKHSPEARQLLAGLTADAALLRVLPVRLAPADLEGRILRLIPATTSVERPVLASPPRWPIMISTMVAACAVLCVSLVGWSLMAMTNKSLPVESHAHRSSDPIPSVDAPIVRDPPEEAGPRVVPLPVTVVAQDAPTNPISAELAPRQPAPVANVELGSAPKESPELASVVLPRLPEVVLLPALGDAATFERLVGELARADSHRIDVFCRDSHKALDRIQGALKQIGVRTISDSLIQELQKRRFRTGYVVFTGDLNAAEWGRVLKAASVADRKAEEKKPGDGVLDQLVLMPLGSSDQKELSALLGQDLLAHSANGGHDRRRPVADNTADQVAKSIAKSDVGKGARLSIALPTPPARSAPTSSAELRQFLDSRRTQVPGTITVMLVIRSVG